MTDSPEKYQVRIYSFCGQPINTRNNAEKYLPAKKEEDE